MADEKNIETVSWSDLPPREQVKLLDTRLRRVDAVARSSSPGHDEPSAMAFGLVEIVTALRAVERITQAIANEDLSEVHVGDLLTDIGDALREILHHITDMDYYRYVLMEFRSPDSPNKP